MQAKPQTSEMSNLPVHPAAKIFPTMGKAEFAGLKADLQLYGQREPIVLFEGKILDGRNRYRACQELGIEPRTVVGQGVDDPAAYVVSANLHRRHLTTSQRAIIAAKLKKKVFAKAAKVRQRAGQRSGGRGRRKNLEANLPQSKSAGRSRDQAAAAVKVSPRSVDHAYTVLANGSSELVAAVEAGHVNVSSAAEIAKSTPLPEQMAAVKRSRERTGATAKPLPKASQSKNDKPLDLNQALLELDEAIQRVYSSWPVAGRVALASKLRNWANELYESDCIAAMEHPSQK